MALEEKRRLSLCLSAQVLLCWAFPEVGETAGVAELGAAGRLSPALAACGGLWAWSAALNAVNRQAPLCGGTGDPGCGSRSSWPALVPLQGQHWPTSSSVLSPGIDKGGAELPLPDDGEDNVYQPDTHAK